MHEAMEIFHRDQIRKIFDSFCNCLDIRICYYSPSGQPIGPGSDRPISSYCRMMQDDVFGWPSCHKSDQEHLDRAVRLKKMVCYECHAGCGEILMPIYAGDFLLGFIMCGQFRTRDAPPDSAVARGTQASSALMKDHFLRLPFISPDRLPHLQELFRILTEYIVEHNMIVIEGSIVVQQALDYMREHVAEPLSLKKVSAHVHRAGSTLSHLFQIRLGRTFKQAMIELRLERAEALLRTHPDLTVQQAARAVGYEDQYFFSRIFKKYRGHPPSVLRARRDHDS